MNKPSAVAALATLLLLSPAVSALASKIDEASRKPAIPVSSSVSITQPNDEAQPSELVVTLEPNSVEEPAPVLAPATSSEQSLFGNTIGTIADRIQMLATSFLGTPYRWGGTTPRAFDCSGFTRYLYARLGIRLPRTAREQYRAGKAISSCDLRTGDLIFFDMKKGYVSHVGMYMGSNRFIHASNPRSGVRIDSIKGAYRRCFVGARRYEWS